MVLSSHFLSSSLERPCFLPTVYGPPLTFNLVTLYPGGPTALAQNPTWLWLPQRGRPSSRPLLEALAPPPMAILMVRADGHIEGPPIPSSEETEVQRGEGPAGVTQQVERQLRLERALLPLPAQPAGVRLRSRRGRLCGQRMKRRPTVQSPFLLFKAPSSSVC